jgi:hypothetical protein
MKSYASESLRIAQEIRFWRTEYQKADRAGNNPRAVLCMEKIDEWTKIYETYPPAFSGDATVRASGENKVRNQGRWRFWESLSHGGVR